MQTRPNINHENYRDYKPSELIELAIVDIDNAVESGFKIKMDSWFGSFRNPVNDEITGCYVCLGGAVMAGMLPEIKEAIINYNTAYCHNVLSVKNTAFRIAMLFDEIRSNMPLTIADRLRQLYDLPESKADIIRHAINDNWDGEAFYGLLDTFEINNLKKSINSLIAALKSVNY